VLVLGWWFVSFRCETKRLEPMTNQLQTLDQIRSQAVEMGMEFGPKIFVAVVIMVAGYFVARWIAGVAQRSLSKFHLEPPVRILLVRVIRLIVLLLFLLMALTNLNVNLLPLIAGLSVAGAGIALAMQGVLGNLAAGLTIIFTKPFRVGEYIELLDVEGQVDSIELFATTLTHPDRSRVVIPNRKIVGEILHNYGTIRQLDLTVGVAYETDLDEATRIVRQVLQATPTVLKEPAPVVGVVELADSSIQITVKPWTSVADYGATRLSVYQSIVNQFRAAKIVIPFPQREIRVLGDLPSADAIVG
jgi:small conductance mechanosensitive channel